MKTVAIVGMGPLLSLSMARKWGEQGANVAMISRTQSKLDAYAAELGEAGILARGFAADVREPDSLTAAYAEIREHFGPIEGLYYGPTAWYPGQSFMPLETTVDGAMNHFRLLVGGAITSVNALLPDMEARADGVMLFTTGTSAHDPLPFITSLGIANAGLRNYVRCLVDELRAKGVYVGTLSVGVPIDRDGTDNDPDRIADRLLAMAAGRELTDEVYDSGRPWSEAEHPAEA